MFIGVAVTPSTQSSQKRQVTENELRPMLKACLYYGSPIGINDVWDIDEAAEIYKTYNIIVFGDRYQLPDEEDYANTVALMKAIKAINPTVEIFGYIPCGLDAEVADSNLSIEEVRVRIDAWKLIGATGAMLDEFGYDYNITRDRQNDIVSYCHGLGMNVMVNSWNTDYVFSSENLYVDWNDFYGNPNELAPAVNSRDYFMMENMFFGYDDVQEAGSKDRIDEILKYYSTYYDQFRTKSFALDGIQYNHPEKDYMFNRGYLASMLFNFDAYAPSVGGWTSRSYNHFADSYNLSRVGKHEVVISQHGMIDCIYEGDVGDDHIKIVWKPDTVNDQSYTAGYHLAYLNDVLITTGSQAPPAELPDLTDPGYDLVTDGLMYYYNSKEGVTSNQWNDLSPNGYHLELQGPLMDAEGLHFDGVNDRAEVLTEVPTTADFTFEAKMKMANINASTWLILGYRGGTDSRGISFNSSENLRLWDGATSLVSGYIIPVNTFVTITLKKASSTQVALYINGVFNRNVTMAYPPAGICGSLIVGTDDSGQFLNTTIAFIRQYNRVLTDQEIADNYLVGSNIWNITE